MLCTFLSADYATAINCRCPDFMTHPSRMIVTEFGKALVLKTAGVVCKIEDKLVPADEDLPVTVIAHAGEHVFVCLFVCLFVCFICCESFVPAGELIEMVCWQVLISFFAPLMFPSCKHTELSFCLVMGGWSIRLNVA